MYKDHPHCVPPEDPDALIWRYMDFTKFMALLVSKSLFFSPPSQFKDRHEGVYPRENVRAFSEMFSDDSDGGVRGTKMMQETFSKMRQTWGVSCWHINEGESAAMWAQYLKTGEGIAIQSRYSRLRDCFNTDEDIHIGKVRYLNYESEWIDGSIINAFDPILHKRRSFEHEDELRALIHRLDLPHAPDPGGQMSIGAGVHVCVQLDVLIERVYIAPGVQGWITDLVKSVITHHGYEFELVQSSLYGDPLY